MRRARPTIDAAWVERKLDAIRAEPKAQARYELGRLLLLAVVASIASGRCANPRDTCEALVGVAHIDCTEDAPV